MQKVVSRTVDPRAFDLLIDESFIRQGDLIKAVQDSLQQGVDLEHVLLEKYRVPKAALGKALSKFFDCPYIPYDEKTIVDPQLTKDSSCSSCSLSSTCSSTTRMTSSGDMTFSGRFPA